MAWRVQPHEHRTASPAEQLLDDLVARWSSAGGIVRPRALAGLMTSSNAGGWQGGRQRGAIRAEGWKTGGHEREGAGLGLIPLGRWPGGTRSTRVAEGDRGQRRGSHVRFRRAAGS